MADTDHARATEPGQGETDDHRAASRRGLPFYLGAVLTALFSVRLLGASWGTHFPAVWPDATWPKESYRAVAALTPFRPAFYFAYRPIGYPAFLWLFGRSSPLVVIAQTALYCVAVGALCVTAWRLLRSRVVAGIAIALIIGIASQAKYAMWNTQILSESISISLGFLVVALWWRFAAEPSRPRAIWAFSITIAWMVVRDADVLPATVVIVPIVLIVAWRSRTSIDARLRRTLLSGALAIVLAAGYSFVSEKASHRAMLSFHHVVGIRILPDPQLTKFFVSHGMPLDDALRTRTGKSGLEDNFYRNTEPRFAKYRAWASTTGRTWLVLSMVLEASHYRDLMYKDMPSILKADVSYYDTQGTYNRLPRNMPFELGGPTTRRGLTSWTLLAIIALGAIALIASHRKRGWGVLVFAAAALFIPYFEMYFTWVGDPVEVQRHMVGALSRMAVVLVIVIAIGTDMLVSYVRAADEGSPQEAAPVQAEQETVNA